METQEKKITLTDKEKAERAEKVLSNWEKANKPIAVKKPEPNYYSSEHGWLVK